ncbi:MAG: CYTH and CHAD domain-containing protein [Actinobacteria bacterium]|nr:CYTH and CHAD domain-containing protein [Actinomycetota bacterium]
MREHLERELKLRPRAGFVLPELGGESLPTRIFVSTYHDTADLALARHGVTFRYRIEDGAGLWQLKLPKGVARIELEEPGAPARPPAEMTALLVAYVRDRPLVPVARLRTRREGVRARGAEIVDDSVAVMEGPRVTRRFREVEIDLLEGDERTLRRLEKEIRAAGADAAETTPKLYRALDLTLPAGPVEVTPSTPPVEALGLALEEQLRRLLAHDPGTRLGTDIEDLHQLRVSTRMLRAYLRTARALVDRRWADDLRVELGWLGRALGPARDLDVLLEWLSADVSEVGNGAPEGAALLAHVEAERGPARKVVLEALSSERYLLLLEWLSADVSEVGNGAPEGAALLAHVEAERGPARKVVLEALSSERYLLLLDRLEQAVAPPASGDTTPLGRIWAKETKRLRAAVKALGKNPPDERLHAVRIDVKRARYAAALAAHELGKAGARFVEAAKAAQDVLGEHQDSVIAEERIAAWAAERPSAKRFAARLVEREHERQYEARRSWPAAWKELDAAARKVEV